MEGYCRRFMDRQVGRTESFSGREEGLEISREKDGKRRPSEGCGPNAAPDRKAAQCVHLGNSVTSTMRSDKVNSHWSACAPAASAARAMNPRWRLLAKLWMWSTQIPVKLATSESVKIFWLDFTVTMVLLLDRASLPLASHLCNTSVRC